MTRRDRRRSFSLARAGSSGARSRPATHPIALPARVGRADRRSLLLGTALASTLLIAVLAAPTPAHAVVTCASDVGTGPTPINHSGISDSIVCVNTEARTGASAIRLNTLASNNGIELDTTGTLTATEYGIYVSAGGIGLVNSPVNIVSRGDIIVGGGGTANGINASADTNASPITITNSGDITLRPNASGYAAGIQGTTSGVGSVVSITNSGEMDIVTQGNRNGFGIQGITTGNSAVVINNSGDMEISAFSVHAIQGRSYNGGSVFIGNSAALTLTGRANIVAITGQSFNGGSLSIDNSGAITATGSGDVFGVFAQTLDANSAVDVFNSGDMDVTSTADDAYGILARTGIAGSAITITNTGPITATSGDLAFGIAALVYGNTVAITNNGSLMAQGSNLAVGIYARVLGAGGSIDIVNRGDIRANGMGQLAFGIRVASTAGNTPISIVNSGDITATGDTDAIGIFADVQGGNSPVSIVNSGAITASAGSGLGIGIAVVSPNGSVRIENSGSIRGSLAGIFVQDSTGTTIVNSGAISSSTQFAIDVQGAGAGDISNSGTITGFVDLTEQGDTFVNQSGGVFETKLTSFFGGGSDVFRNQAGGTVHALRSGGVDPSFAGLERFENRGTISTVDGSVGDSFTLSNTPGGKDLNFVASGNSRLAVDAFLGASGSASDTFTIEGNVSGTTAVTINNTNGGAGVFNPTGIKVVTVTGATPNADAFYMDQPADTGFFDYDLFFTPTGSGFWSLKSFAGAGAFLLPQLVTAAQDIWHQSSSTWFDRTTDLRVLLNGGGAAAYDQGGKSLSAAPSDGIAPAVWVRGSGSWLQRDDSASTSAYGRNYQFDLDRDLETIDFQVGLDMGTRDVLSAGDALVFGLLGGFIHADLDYDSITRNFDYDGGQVGAYATYMKGGLFVDTLLNMHLYELDANNVGFPSELDATTVGLRTDTGYRFGSFSGGAFLEPLATIEVTWADIDGFSLGGNTVSFDDDANVRGRLGLRAGTTTEAWEGTMMEPFVTGSLWGNLSGDNQATLVSSGSTFRFEDELDDVWGEVSAGVNFFNFSQTTAVFAKVDVTFGEDVSGVGGKAGMRVSW